MFGKFTRLGAGLVVAVEILTPAICRADALCDCPGSSYAACHYNFPLLWNLCAHCRFRRHAEAEPPPPVNEYYYDYRSHCPYADPAVLAGFPSMTQRAKLAARASGGQ
jgi:hypothetical protein